MSLVDKSEPEIAFEQLRKSVNDLAQEKKAKEAALKELNAQLRLSEQESASAIQKAVQERDEQIAILRQAVAPYHDAKHVAENLQRDIEVLREEKRRAVTEIKEAKGLVLQEMNHAIEKAAMRLAKIEQAIAQSKATVAAV
jgi:hypothetical protein